MSGGGRTYLPDATEGAIYDRLYDVYKTLYPALHSQFRDLQDVMNAT